MATIQPIYCLNCQYALQNHRPVMRDCIHCEMYRPQQQPTLQPALPLTFAPASAPTSAPASAPAYAPNPQPEPVFPFLQTQWPPLRLVPNMLPSNDEEWTMYTTGAILDAFNRDKEDKNPWAQRLGEPWLESPIGSISSATGPYFSDISRKTSMEMQGIARSSDWLYSTDHAPISQAPQNRTARAGSSHYPSIRNPQRPAMYDFVTNTPINLEQSLHDQDFRHTARQMAIEDQEIPEILPLSRTWSTRWSNGTTNSAANSGVNSGILDLTPRQRGPARALTFRWSAD